MIVRDATTGDINAVTAIFKSRMEDGAGTNPEELIGAAHAGCFTMALSAQLSGAGLKPEHLHTKATVNFTKAAAGWTIDRIDLASSALAGVDIHLTATLL